MGLTVQLHPEAILMFMSAVAAVLVAYIESRRSEPSQHSYERYDRLVESMVDMRERMAIMEQRYKLYPHAERLVEFEYKTEARLDKLEAKPDG